MTDSGVTVQAVQFMDDVISISYAEDREQAKQVGLGRTMFIRVESAEEEITELLDLLRDIIDKGLLVLRNPPTSVARSVNASPRPVADAGGSVNPSAVG